MEKLGVHVNRILGGILPDNIISIINKLDSKADYEINVIDTEEKFKDVYVSERIQFRDNVNNTNPNVKYFTTRETFTNIYNIYLQEGASAKRGERTTAYYSGGTVYNSIPKEPEFEKLGQFTVFISEKITRELGRLISVSQTINIYIR